jgi:DNA-binding transcriptional regulator YhcF (GntR family)
MDDNQKMVLAELAKNFITDPSIFSLRSLIENTKLNFNEVDKALNDLEKSRHIILWTMPNHNRVTYRVL